MRIDKMRAYVLSRVNADGACWLWLGQKTVGGYGLGCSSGVKTTAHRIAYMAWVGEIPRGLEIDHLCRNTICVNPKHLEAVTRAENIKRGKKAQQTHCVNGHRFDSENTRIRKNGCRFCRECHRKTERMRWHNKTAEQRSNYNLRKRQLYREKGIETTNG